MLPAFSLQIETFSDAVELQRKCRKQPKSILLSEIEDTNDEGENVFKSLSQSRPDAGGRPGHH